MTYAVNELNIEYKLQNIAAPSPIFLLYIRQNDIIYFQFSRLAYCQITINLLFLSLEVYSQGINPYEKFYDSFS
jgi:hypothetical protein